MPRKLYTTAVLLCAMAWLLVGLQVSTLDDLAYADAPRRWLPLALLLVCLVLAVADTWVLLRRGSAEVSGVASSGA